MAELEASAMGMKVSGGETIVRIGNPVKAVPLLASGIEKVSRMNDAGMMILLYYLNGEK